jgi:Hemerythrin HHE cation binding domain
MAVDTWEMVVVHRLFRREFGNAAALIDSVRAGDRARAEVVGRWLADVVKGLHHHHHSEDDLLWPVLLDRVDVHAALVRRMEGQHQRLGVLLDEIGTVLPRWRRAADAADRDRLIELFGRASVLLAEHLGEEEREILPLVAEHLTQPEWDALGARGQESMRDLGRPFLLVGAILEEATPSERDRFLAQLPAPLRLAWRAVGQRSYARGIAQIRGSAA